MKIERTMIPKSTLEEFADKHGLVMEVRERPKDRLRGVKRYYARFKGVDMKNDRSDRFLRGTMGDGDTEDEAIENYGRWISEKLLVVDAGKETRQEIEVPRIVRGST